MGISSYYNKSAEVYRSSGQDAYGQTGAFVKVSDISGFIDALSGDTVTSQGRAELAADFIFITDPHDVREGDVLKISGAEYEVMFVDDPAGMGRHLEIELKAKK